MFGLEAQDRTRATLSDSTVAVLALLHAKLNPSALAFESMMKFTGGSIALLGFASLSAVSDATSTDPITTPATESGRERATTSFYSLVTTPIPKDEHSIGMGLQREGTDQYCKFLRDTFDQRALGGGHGG